MKQVVFSGLLIDTARQVRQYRIKPPPIDMLSQMAIFHKDGRPRILSNDPESRVPTLHLSCTCEGAVASGLPCACMLAVARSVGGVLSLRHFSPHWLSNKLIDFPGPAPLFTQNQRRVLAVDEVLSRAQAEDAPSAVPGSMRPTIPTVITYSDATVDSRSVVTQDGEMVESDRPLDGVETGTAKSSSRRSRRYK